MSQDRTDASDYLLGELDDQARERLEQRLRDEPALRAQVEALRPIVATLRELPAAAWPGPLAPPPPLRPHRRINRSWLRVAATAAAIAVVGGVAGYELHRPATPRSAAVGPSVVLDPLGPGASQAQATAVMAAHGRMIVTFRGLPRTQPGRFYELWLMTNRRHLLALASFGVSPTGAASLSLPLPADPRRFTYLDVSLQTDGGGTQHSGDSVLRGKIA